MRSICLGAAAVGAAVGVVAAAAQGDDGAAAVPALADRLLRAGGRLHPMLVHFPIGLLLTAAAIEWIGLPFRRHAARQRGDEGASNASPAATACLAIGALAAAAAAWAGWMNADFETHGRSVQSTLTLHRWTGVAAASLALLVLVLRGAAGSTQHPRAASLYRLGLLLTAGFVGLTGHLGGTIVYGTGYLTSVLWPRAERAVEDPVAPVAEGADPPVDPAGGPATGTVNLDELPAHVVYADIRPILEANCFECHGPTKQRGKMRFDRKDVVFGPDRDLWVIVPGDPGASDL
ncbi:MAG: hypothetical protein KDA22_08745, partial [Phycisphaerales bacterium]|nr:hypothetical protein [Phycisphaerales bacterium]